jgi:hypothetical protein
MVENTNRPAYAAGLDMSIKDTKADGFAGGVLRELPQVLAKRAKVRVTPEAIEEGLSCHDRIGEGCVDFCQARTATTQRDLRPVLEAEGRPYSAKTTWARHWYIQELP